MSAKTTEYTLTPQERRAAVFALRHAVKVVRLLRETLGLDEQEKTSETEIVASECAALADVMEAGIDVIVLQHAPETEEERSHRVASEEVWIKDLADWAQLELTGDDGEAGDE